MGYGTRHVLKVSRVENTGLDAFMADWREYEQLVKSSKSKESLGNHDNIMSIQDAWMEPVTRDTELELLEDNRPWYGKTKADVAKRIRDPFPAFCKKTIRIGQDVLLFQVMERAHCDLFKMLLGKCPGKRMFDYWSTFKDIVMGLYRLAQDDIVHNDLKAENVLLVRDGGTLRAKI